jgi:hypothetical protein
LLAQDQHQLVTVRAGFDLNSAAKRAGAQQMGLEMELGQRDSLGAEICCFDGLENGAEENNNEDV